MAEATMKPALVKAKAEAEKLAAAVNDIMARKIASEEWKTAWMRIRTESQKLLYLREDQFSIGEELKKVQDRFDAYCSKSDYLKRSTASLRETLTLAQQWKVSSAETFERKEQQKVNEIESMKKEITILTNPCFGVRDSRKKRLCLAFTKVHLERKIEREANKRASFDSKVTECDEELRKKMAKLKRIEQKVVVVGETLKLMKDALRCCEEAITMFNLVFVHRLRNLDSNFAYEIAQTADVGIIKRIYLLKDCFDGFKLDFSVSTLDLCAEISNIAAIDMEPNVKCTLSIDNQGLCHITTVK